MMGTARDELQKYHAMLARGDSAGLKRFFASVAVTVNGENQNFLEAIDTYVAHYRIERIQRSWIESRDSAVCEAIIRGAWVADGVQHRIVQPWCEVGRIDDRQTLTSLAIYLDPTLDAAVRLAAGAHPCHLRGYETAEFGSRD